jgi:translation machinery-associated protein 16
VKARRPGRPAHPKQVKLQQQIEKEREEFRTGFLVPNMGDWENVEKLKRWDGTTGGLAQIKFTRVTREPLPKKDDEDAMEE